MISVTGLGVVCSAGLNRDQLWQSALDESSGLGSDGLGTLTPQMSSLYEAHPQHRSLSKSAFFAQIAIDQAMTQAGWASLNTDDGMIIATTVGQITKWEDQIIRFLRQEMDAQSFSHFIHEQPLGSITEALRASLAFKGKSLIISSACSAATQAIGLAAEWIKQGRVKRCLVGGTEALCQLTIEGFRSLQLLSRERSRPFDQNRSGINLSEGAAFFCLEKPTERSLVQVIGAGFSTDAYHMASPHPEGRGSFEAMSKALENAKITPNQVNWVHAHGTGSKANDQAEGAAITQLFGSAPPWVSSTKWLHGHALGASGAIESVLCVEAMLHNTVLRTAGLTQPDPLIQIRHPATHQKTSLQYVLKNTLGFGGNNAAIVFGKMGATK